MRSVSSVFDFFDVWFGTFLELGRRSGGQKIVLDCEFDSMFGSRFLGVVYVFIGTYMGFVHGMYTVHNS